jgi:hypothetical protein
MYREIDSQTIDFSINGYRFRAKLSIRYNVQSDSYGATCLTTKRRPWILPNKSIYDKRATVPSREGKEGAISKAKQMLDQSVERAERYAEDVLD